MEIQKQEHLFKKIAQYGGLTLFGVIVVFAVAFSMNPDIAKYFLGSLLNGVSINTLTSSNHYAYGENIGWIDFNPTGGNVKVGDNGLNRLRLWRKRRLDSVRRRRRNPSSICKQ